LSNVQTSKNMLSKFNYIESEIQDQYLSDESDRPWIIGFSGGKDSTLLLQLIWQALSKLANEAVKLTRDIYVVCNDTLVENPAIVSNIETTLKKIEDAAVKQSVPFYVQKTKPRLEDTFWVNLIGRGYPAPNNIFRWCTERLKINPTTRFITEKISEKGEVIILLGTRSAESSNRARSIKKHEVKGQRLRKHLLPNAYVYAPIKDVETEELWQYLLQNPAPWGGSHRALVTLYNNASGGDCPLVIDTTTPSCGQSRFGCWVCTVVKKDKSMDALIDNGEEWMEPLSEFRDYLMETRDNGEQYREKFGRDGKLKPDGQFGPYKPEVRAEFLRRLLEAQRAIQETQGEVELITHQELIAIDLQWHRDAIFQPKVADIYNEVYNKEIVMTKKNEKLQEEEKLLQEVCKTHPEDADLIQSMLLFQKSKALMLRKRGLQNDLENILDSHLLEQKKKQQ
jgi:DNA sulfur modification protein DndC